MSAFLDRLRRAPLIAILRGLPPEQAEEIGVAVLDGGFEIIEVPLNSPRPFESIERVAKRLSERALIGAGTVLQVSDLARLRDAGGRLVVMPHADEVVVRGAKALGLICVPGFATPTEAFRMIAAGADALKLFPAEASSPAVLKSLRAVLPAEVPVIPVGGVDARSMDSWYQAGAGGFGIGSALYRPGDPIADVRKRAAILMQSARSRPL